MSPLVDIEEVKKIEIEKQVHAIPLPCIAFSWSTIG